MKRKETNKPRVDSRNFFDLSLPVFIRTYKKELCEEFSQLDEEEFYRFCVLKYNQKLKNELEF